MTIEHFHALFGDHFVEITDVIIHNKKNSKERFPKGKADDPSSPMPGIYAYRFETNVDGDAIDQYLKIMRSAGYPKGTVGLTKTTYAMGDESGRGWYLNNMPGYFAVYVIQELVPQDAIEKRNRLTTMMYKDYPKITKVI